MYFSGSELPANHLESADVCIVGAGPAGLVLAASLIKKGLTVVLLEAGPWVDQPPKRLEGDVVGLEYDLYSSRASAVGGSAHLWNADAGSEGPRVRLRPLDRMDVDGDPGWPIEYDRLVPYLDDAADLMGVGRAPFPGVESVDNEPPLVPAPFRFGLARVFTEDLPKEVADKARVVTGARVVSFLQDANGRILEAIAMTESGHLVRGRGQFFVLATGGIRNATVLLEGLRSGLVIEGEDWVGKTFMEHPHLNLALLDGGFDVIDDGQLIWSEGQWVEKRFRLPRSDIERGAARMAVVARSGEWADYERRIRAGTPTPGRRSLSVLRRSLNRGVPPRNLSRHLRRIVNPLSWRSEQQSRSHTSDRLVVLSAMTEQRPSASSRVKLATRRDSSGLSVDALEWRLTGDDVAALMAGRDAFLNAIAPGQKPLHDFLAGLDTSLPGERNYGVGFHHMGTTRMAASSRHGVVDGNLALFGVDNMFVAGSSVFPTSGYANPTLTLVALSLRLADHISSLKG